MISIFSVNALITPNGMQLNFSLGFETLSAEKPLTKITVYCHLQRKNKKLSTAFANACTSARLRQTVG